MISVSNDFKKAMKQPIKELDAYIKLDDNSKIKSADDLISFKISCDSGMCKTAMRKLEAKYLGEHNLLGRWVHVGYGVRLSTGTFEYLDYGSFLVTEITTAKDTGVTMIVAYDKMISTMKEYNILDVEYPIDLYTYTQELCKACNLELGNLSFNIHNDWTITQELWENISGITYRDILVQIAQATASTCIIGCDNKVYFKSITATNEILTYDNMKKLKLEPIYGEINSVVLSRTPQEDNIYMRDEESIENNGLTEYKIENNEIIDKDRDNAMTPIYNALHGISYYPFETTTEGLGWYEIADNFDIVNDTADVFNTSLFNFSISVDGSIKEILKTSADTKTQTQYQYATTIAKRLINTELIVDKQNGEIKALTSKVSVLDDIYTKEQMNELLINSEKGLTNIFKQTGGNNLLKNSALYFKTNGTFDYWTGDAEKIIYSESQSNTAIKLKNNSFKQSVSLANSDYTLSFKYERLNELATASVKINNEETALDEKGTFTKQLTVETNQIELEFNTSLDDSYIIYELMLNTGTEASPWSQYQNEVHTDTVNISKGIEVEATENDTKATMNADGFNVINKNTQANVLKATDTGIETTDIKADKGTIGGVLMKKVQNQSWITGV